MKKTFLLSFFLFSCSSKISDPFQTEESETGEVFILDELPDFLRDPVVVCYEGKRSCFAQMTPSVSVPVYHSCLLEEWSQDSMDVSESQIYSCLDDPLTLPNTKCKISPMGNPFCFIELSPDWWAPVGNGACDLPSVHSSLWGEYKNSEECENFQGDADPFEDSFCVPEIPVCFGSLVRDWGVQIVPSCVHSFQDPVPFDWC